MNIGVDIRSLVSPIRTGVGEYTHQLLKTIFKLDQQNHYWLFYNSLQDVNKNIPKWEQDNIHYLNTHWPNKLFNACLKFFKRPKLDKLIKQDLDIFFSPNLNFTSLTKKTKHILTIHDLSFKFYPEFFSYKRRCWHKIIKPKKQCQRANLILTPSFNTKMDLINHYDIKENKIKVVYPGLATIFNRPLPDNVGKIKKKYNLPDDFILFLGTIEPRKNIIGLVEAFEQAHKQLHKPHSLVIAGSDGWNTRPIKQRIAKSPYRQKIHLIGYVDTQDKPTLYSLASIFVYPSFYEGFGFPVLEAMSMGVPVITANRSSLPEITNNSAYLINPNKFTEITQAMVNLINGQNLKELLTKKALEQSKKFTWGESAKQWIKIINNI